MGNFLVYKSSAGSGKTYTLMLEYLSLALKNTSAYSHILAITFTNKAANEIKQRILENLKKLASMKSGPVPDKEREFVNRLMDNTDLSETQLIDNAHKVLTAILHHYSDFAVSTIDSFMHKVIRSFAFDLKLSMNFEVELDTASLLNAAVDELISKVGKDDELTDILKNYVIRKAENDEGWDISNDLKKNAASLFKEKMLGLMPALNEKTFTKQDYITICNTISLLNEQRKAEGKKAVDLIRRVGLELTDFRLVKSGIGCYFEKVALGEFPNVSNTIKSAYNEDLWFKNGSENYSKLEPVKDDLKLAGFAIEKTGDDLRFLELIRDNFHSTLLLKKINDELNIITQQRNVVPISDFNTLISEVVREQPVPFIYLRVGEKFRNFMIDEFQDTSELQWENLLPLIENSLADARLNMIVGDGKQAIYRFKNGNAEQFINLPKLVNKSGNPFTKDREQMLIHHYEEKNLDTNYRSRQEIVEFNNDFFKFAAPKFIPDNELVYKEVKQEFKPDNRGGLVQFDFMESDLIIDKIIELISQSKNDGYEYGDIAILCRVNKDAINVAEALQRSGIKVVSSESLLLSSAPEVNFLMNWISFLANPDNRVSMQGITEYLLYTKATELAGRYHRKDDKQQFYELLAMLGVDINKHTFDSLSFYDSVELLIRIFGLNHSNPVYTRFFLDEILKFTQKESSGPSGFMEFWQQNSSKLSISMTRNKDAVQILTVHKSKGLAFPVVIYAFPDQHKDFGDLTWDQVKISVTDKEKEEEVIELPLVYHYSSKLKGTPLEGGYLLEESRNRLDKFNLYYVAFTRAAERLYVVLEEIKKQADSPSKLADLVALYLQQRNQGNVFGNGEKVKGNYKDADATAGNKESDAGNTDLSQTSSAMTSGLSQAGDAGNTGILREDHKLNLAYQTSDWREKITLAKRSPDDWNTGAMGNLPGVMDGVTGKVDYGKMVHLVFSEINTLNDIDRAVDFVFLHMDDSSGELKRRILNSMKNLASEPEIAPFFNGGKVIKEQEILTPEGESYRPDRVVCYDEVTYVVDFKTGMANDKHSKQVLLYMKLMEEMGYPEVTGYILYLGEKIELVSVAKTDVRSLT